MSLLSESFLGNGSNLNSSQLHKGQNIFMNTTKTSSMLEMLYRGALHMCQFQIEPKELEYKKEFTFQKPTKKLPEMLAYNYLTFCTYLTEQVEYALRSKSRMLLHLLRLNRRRKMLRNKNLRIDLPASQCPTCRIDSNKRCFFISCIRLFNLKTHASYSVWLEIGICLHAKAPLLLKLIVRLKFQWESCNCFMALQEIAH